MTVTLTDITCPACGNRLTKMEALAIYSQVHYINQTPKTRIKP